MVGVLSSSVGPTRRTRWSQRVLTVAVTLGLMATMIVGGATPAAAKACRNGRVALTFDDGPSGKNTKRLVNVLKKNRARATFFLNGRNVRAHPRKARLIKAKSRRIYNHTYDHPDLTKLSNSAIRSQVKRTEKAFRAARARSFGKLVRPPYGATNSRVRRVLRGIGFHTVLWNVDTRDWAGSTTENQIVNRVSRGLRPGANILMHDQHDTYATMRAVPRIVRMIRKRGYCLGFVGKKGRVVRP